MLPPGAEGIDFEKIRPLKRVEYDRLVAEGFFHDERVELVFGRIVQMSPIDPAHCESTARIDRILMRLLGDRATVRCQASFAARDDSEPEPDIYVTPNGDYWRDHPSRAFVIVEVARSSLRWDRGTKALLYGLSHVDEYWIVNHVDAVVEVYRDRADDGTWRSLTTYGRGDTIAMLAFPEVSFLVGEILPPI
jgi:Uma2 family endonuclease